jgi:hypothetical protein
MTTVAQLRSAIIGAAERALEAEPTNQEARLRSFAARLSGSLQHLQETSADKAVWALVGWAQADADLVKCSPEVSTWLASPLPTSPT